MVTGAGQGVGREAAARFAAEGTTALAASPTAARMADLPDHGAVTAVAPDVTRMAFLTRQPTGRLGEASNMAAAALSLASDDCRFMTGQGLVVDEGRTL